jgi:uridine phosphorylase
VDDRTTAQCTPTSLAGGKSPIPSVANYAEITTKRNLQSANFPLDQDGRTYHVGTRKGEVANRILGVGSLGRARMLGDLLKPMPRHNELTSVESSRGFLTLTGQWKGCPVSIVTHLMGFGNLDLFLRETRAVTEPPLLVIRVGTCGSLNGKVGQFHVASHGAVAVLRDPDAFHETNTSKELSPYRITKPVMPDGPLTDALVSALHELLGDEGVYPSVPVLSMLPDAEDSKGVFSPRHAWIWPTAQ